MKVSQSCPTLCDSVEWTVCGILQVRILEWAFPFSRGPSQPRNQTQVSWFAGGFFTSWATREARLVTKSYPTLMIPWTVACQAPLSMGFSRQEYWSWVAISFPKSCIIISLKCVCPLSLGKQNRLKKTLKDLLCEKKKSNEIYYGRGLQSQLLWVTSTFDGTISEQDFQCSEN